MSQVLALHNALRARHGASPLSWSASLAAASQDWANRCVFQHSGGGENLAQYFSSPTQAVQVGLNCVERGCLLGSMVQAFVLLFEPDGPSKRTKSNPPPTPLPANPLAWYNKTSLYIFNVGQYSSATGHATTKPTQPPSSPLLANPQA